MSSQSLIFSYLTLRKSIGILGIALPFVLYLGAFLVFSESLQSSLSSYYHTGMRDVFVGTICVIGVFMFSYLGYEQKDRVAGNLACFFALGLALFPTAPDVPGQGDAPIIGILHLAFATLFFCTLIYFSLYLFTKSDPDGTPTAKKLQRNLIYRICGYTMIICIVLIVIYMLLPDITTSGISATQPVFWLESVTIIAFGISWITKGEAILADDSS